MSEFTIVDKIKALARELALRKNVYPQWVAKRKMNAATAQHEIGVMEAMLDDYKTLHEQAKAAAKAVEIGNARLHEQRDISTAPKDGTWYPGGKEIMPASTTEREKRMIDIVELLRSLPDSSPRNNNIVAEAADQIEHLRAEIKRLQAKIEADDLEARAEAERAEFYDEFTERMNVEAEHAAREDSEDDE